MVSLSAEFVSPGLSQPSLPDLAQIKVAAESGDAKAQDQLGGNYLSQKNFSAAAKWYETAAKQGVVNSQWQLGRVLLHGEPKIAAGSVAVPKDKDAGIRWLLLAANQGHGGAQVDIGSCYETGDGVKQDYVEACKWYRLASQESSPSSGIAKMYLNRISLKLTPEQIAEGQKRADSFVPGKPQVEPPSLLEKIVLQSISGPATGRLAVINNTTFVDGGTAEVKVGAKSVKVFCVEVREKSVVVRIEGLEGQREIQLKQQPTP
jgi:hypothetical protein